MLVRLDKAEEAVETKVLHQVQLVELEVESQEPLQVCQATSTVQEVETLQV